MELRGVEPRCGIKITCDGVDANAHLFQQRFAEDNLERGRLDYRERSFFHEYPRSGGTLRVHTFDVHGYIMYNAKNFRFFGVKTLYRDFPFLKGKIVV